nr:carbohydrate porin [Pontixanthobacter rizhaonensis]
MRLLLTPSWLVLSRAAPLSLACALLCGTSSPVLASELQLQEEVVHTVVDTSADQVETADSGNDGAQTPPPPEPAKTAERVTIRGIWSQFLDLPVSGDADQTLRYGGKADAYIDVKGSAVGIDDSLSLHVHPEFKYGKSSNGEIGLIPENAQLFYPGDGDVFDLSINVTKRWKSGASLTVGKINILDLAALTPLQGGGGHEGFQNLAVALPPSAIVPGSVTGALINVPTEKVLLRAIIFDPELQSRRSGLEDPFSKGVGILASATFPVRVGGKRGYYGIKFAGSTRSEVAAGSLPAALVPGPGSSFGNRKGEFSVILTVDQYLSEDAAVPGNGIGIFGQLYLSNGDPTFLDASGFIGIAGNPKKRPQDRFGVTYFRYSLADGLVNALRNRIPLQDEEGVEAFYTVGLAKTLRLTGNLQIVDSAISPRAVGITTGLRLTALF